MFPVCSFCGESPIVAWFEGPDFKVSVAGPDQVRSQEAWLACSPCLLLVKADNRERLARRGARRAARRLDQDLDFEQTVFVTRDVHDEIFWKPRDAKPER